MFQNAGKTPLAIALFAVLSLMRVSAAKDEVTSVTWSPHVAGMGCHMNMGPTGARVWMRGYQFQVMTVDAGSPADGVLRRGDLIFAAGGTTFGEKADPRMTLGNAIGAAEADDGILKLKILRDGSKKSVELKLPATGPFSSIWPYDCMKSKRILYQACDYLAEAQMPDGDVITDGSNGTFTAGLLLLASGDVRYLDAARRAAHASAEKDYDKIEYSNWPKGYGAVLMAEYFLATGDRTVLAKIKEVVDSLAKGQMRCGSWGHNGPSEGYGALNQVGLICAMAMVLAQECGIEVDQVALNKTLTFFGRYAELGAVPYGDHMPGTQWPDDNGKNSMAAVLFSLLADRSAERKAFSESVAMSYASREMGHTGGFFSLMWGPLGCAMEGRESLHAFMDYQSWYYNLCRTWKGALVLLPYKEALTRFDDSCYNWSGGEFTSGGMGLAFALPMKRLRILGAPRSVFGAPLQGDLLKIRELYQARDWEAFDKAVASGADHTTDAAEKGWLEQLKAAGDTMRASRARTIKEIENNIEEGDGYRASEQYRSLKKLWGVEDADLKALGEKFEEDGTQWSVREGKQYYDAWENTRAFAIKSWVAYYGDKAKFFEWDIRKLGPDLWEDLAATSEKTPQTWRVLRLAAGMDLPEKWTAPAFNDTDWQASEGLAGPAKDRPKENVGDRVLGRRTFELEQTPFRGLRIKLRAGRETITDVFLNGVQVAHVVRGPRSGYGKIELDESTLGLIHKGKNWLAIVSTTTGKGGNALDVGLQAVIAEHPWEGPLRTGSAARGPQNGTIIEQPLPSLPEKERASRSDQLRVEDALVAYNADLDAGYDAKSIEVLLGDMGSQVPYRRYLAESALARKGLAGFDAAVEALGHADWRVRSAACNAMGKAWSGHEPKDDAAASAMKQQIPALVGLLGDEHFWVRVCAVNALSMFGMDAGAEAAGALAKAAADKHEWVRCAAIQAIKKVTKDPAPLLAAARSAMMVPDTAFSAVNGSMKIIEECGAEQQGLGPALIYVLENPGEGMGSEVMAKVLEQLVAMEGEKAVPVLGKVALGGYAYDRLRGNPRGKAIELLAGLGPKAKAAVPVLKKIAESEEDKDKKFRDAALKAVEAIMGK